MAPINSPALIAGSHGTEYSSIVALQRLIPRIDAKALALVTSQVVVPADVVVDLHGGDLDENLRPYSYWFRGGRAAQDSAGLRLALAFGLDHIIVTDVNPAAPNAGRSLSSQARSGWTAPRRGSPRTARASFSRPSIVASA